MYTLYGSPTSAAFAPLACLEETGADYRLYPVDTGKGENLTPEYLRINPAGKVPSLDMDGKIVTEAAAICALIAERHPDSGLAPAISDAKRPDYLMWLVHLTNTLQPAALRFYYPERHTSKSSETEPVTTAAQAEMATLWSRIEAHLAKNGPYMLGDRFSAPDLFVYMLSTWQECCPGLYDRYPSVKRLADLVAARPAVKRAEAGGKQG